MMIYKVCSMVVWEEIRQLTSWNGSPHDHRDGFIHFSTASQLEGTLRKHYAGQTDLILLAIDAETLGDALKWEPSRGEDLFPHLYGPLPISTVVSAQDLTAYLIPVVAENRALPGGLPSAAAMPLTEACAGRI